MFSTLAQAQSRFDQIFGQSKMILVDEIGEDCKKIMKDAIL